VSLWAKRVGIALATLLIGIQFVPVARSNAPVHPATGIYTSEPVPSPVRSVLESSCQNCHSSQTIWPWYSYVAPVSWLVVHHVKKGRSELNFSEWNTYPAKRKEQKLEEICEQVMNGDMPDNTYLLIHRSAKLSEQQREDVCTWAQAPR